MKLKLLAVIAAFALAAPASELTVAKIEDQVVDGVNPCAPTLSVTDADRRACVRGLCRCADLPRPGALHLDRDLRQQVVGVRPCRRLRRNQAGQRELDRHAQWRLAARLRELREHVPGGLRRIASDVREERQLLLHEGPWLAGAGRRLGVLVQRADLPEQCG